MDNRFYNQRYALQDEYGRGTYNLAGLIKQTVVRKKLNSFEKIQLLDVGCGAGLFCEAFIHQAGCADRIGRIAGIDLVEASDRVSLPGFEFYPCNLNDDKLPFDGEAFNVIFCNHVVEHVFNTEHLFRELHRVAAAGSLVVVSTPNLGWWVNRMLLLFGLQPVGTEVGTESIAYGSGPLSSRLRSFFPAGHIRLFTARALRDLALASGFTVMGWWNQNLSWQKFLPACLTRSMGILLTKQSTGANA